ncbi:BQ5605_C006g04053 [Microbotryum silenes-dioicae]|uniref:BQ5605_C006g04053 protein n=1 Tax=Microbotryum silenes-dioicae TaxID=796604 RepID=A0A2X0MA07_9BASI|nr:BQ5605_C006g04053 [Microbotryum silenes-dioicae]
MTRDYTKIHVNSSSKVTRRTPMFKPRRYKIVLSSTTLKAGTIILTGTPSGIGFFYEPKEILVHGSIFKVESGGIGSLINEVVEEGKV